MREQISTLNEILQKQNTEISKIEQLLENSQKQINIQSDQLGKINQQVNLLKKQYDLSYENANEQYNSSFLSYRQAIIDLGDYLVPLPKKVVINETTTKSIIDYANAIRDIINRHINSPYIVGDPKLFESWLVMQSDCYKIIKTVSSSSMNISSFEIVKKNGKLERKIINQDSIAKKQRPATMQEIRQAKEGDFIYFISLFRKFYYYNANYIKRVTKEDKSSRIF